MLDPSDQEFLNRLHAAIGANLANEQFGVSELAQEMSMSRSNLLRKVRKVSDKPVNQLIREVRLQKAMDLLRTSSHNISEVSHQVGFGSLSYFIKCFREQYGFPPGEVSKKSAEELDRLTANEVPSEEKRRSISVSVPLIAAIVVVALVAGVALYYYSNRPTEEKSIVVLPFKNESGDSTNIYLINGLMESTLTNLQKISGLRVISRTTAESFRNVNKSIPEVARELNVKYVVEGSGQKIGDKILLNIQLIEGASDRHLWAKQYRSEVGDIFELQQEIALNIADEIEVAITPEIEKKIDKRISSDPVAYDYFLKGRDIFYKGSRENLEASIPWFKKAIEKDPNFALAYASAVMVFYYIDLFHPVKTYSLEMASYTDKAMALDPELPESHVARALLHAYRQEYAEAIPEFERAYELDPNNGTVTHFLVEFYNLHVPNTRKYLQYAIRKVKQDIATYDSSTASYNYLHLANGLMQTGFQELALRHINKSIDLDAKNSIARYVKVFIQYAMVDDLEGTRDALLKELAKDTTQFTLYQEVGKAYYYLGDFETAYKYYRKFVDIREAWQVDIFHHEDLKIGIVMEKMGRKEEGEKLIEGFRLWAEKDKTIYKGLHLATYYGFRGNKEEALRQLEEFAKQDNFQYWVTLLRGEPSMKSIEDTEKFKELTQRMRDTFQRQHEEVAVMLKEEGVL